MPLLVWVTATPKTVSVRETNKEMTHKATVLPEGETLTKLAAWLNIPVASLLSKTDEEEQEGPKLTTPEIVEVHLRADKTLKPKTAEALAQMFKLLYEQLSEAQQEGRKKL